MGGDQPYGPYGPPPQGDPSSAGDIPGYETPDPGWPSAGYGPPGDPGFPGGPGDPAGGYGDQAGWAPPGWGQPPRLPGEAVLGPRDGPDPLQGSVDRQAVGAARRCG